MCNKEGVNVVLGVDNLIHCCTYSNSKTTACAQKMPVKRINPDFSKLSDIMWCYECSNIIEESET